MYCKCKTTISSFTTHVVNYKGCIIIIKNLPCDECEQCGEKYYSNEVAKHLESLVNASKQLMQEISVIDYTKAAQTKYRTTDSGITTLAKFWNGIS